MSLRVQSGAARGRFLKSRPQAREVRPIAARIRKSLFDILRPRLPGALFLDLFAGTGLVGIEALSNGAARAVFVDADRRSLRMIEDNLSHLGLKAQAEVVRADVTGDLRLLKGRVFGVIFLGPPYKDERGLPLALSSSALARVFEAGLAGPETWVILQRHEKEKVDVPPERWQKFRENEYGDTRLDFFRIQGAG